MGKVGKSDEEVTMVLLAVYSRLETSQRELTVAEGGSADACERRWFERLGSFCRRWRRCSCSYLATRMAGGGVQ